MTKEQRKIKALEAEIETLTGKLKDAEYWKDYYSKESSRKETEIREIHSTLDSMGVPSKSRGNYNTTLSIGSRLTLLITMIGLSNVVKVKNTLLDEEEA